MRKDRRDAQNSSKDAAESIDDENEAFEDNVMIISFSYNVVGNVVTAAKTENGILRDIALKQNFRNGHMRKSVSGEDTRFSIE